MEKQIVEIGGIYILEPGTIISDIILAIASLYFYLNLRKISDTKYHKFCTLFFLFIGLSSFIGAFAHGFYFYTGKSLHFIAWVLTGLAVYFFELGIAMQCDNRKTRAFFIIFIRMQLIIYIVLTSFFMSFLPVKINTMIGLLGIILPLLIYQNAKSEIRTHIYAIVGILLALIPAFMHRVRFSFGELFNMNDLSHFFLTICLFLIFTSIKQSIENEKARYSEILVN